LLGSNPASKLFGEHPESSIDKIVRVGSIPYRVIGVLKSKGSSAMMRQDDVLITSYTNVRHFQNTQPSYFLGVMVGNVNAMDAATGEATAVFRGIRKLEPRDEENFVIEKSDRVAEMLMGFLSSITGSAGAIGGVLIGNLFSMLLKTGFVVPWAWVILGIVICSLVGLVAGIYPAMKAARLNPIVALRYE